MFDEEARKIVAGAIAQSGAYHRRNALLAGLVGLLACLLVVALDRALTKGVLLISAAALAVTTYRSLKRANRFEEPADSPVLRALVQEPHRIAVVRYEPSREVVVLESDRGDHLDLRAPERREAVDRLLEALASMFPDAALQGRPSHS